MDKHPGDDLTPRERDTLRLLMDGRPTKLIAYEMGITIGTAKAHLNGCRIKLHIHGRAALAVWAVKHPEEVSMVYPSPYPPDTPTERYCSGCEAWHPLSAFRFDWYNKTTRNRACKDYSNKQVNLARQKRKQGENHGI